MEHQHIKSPLKKIISNDSHGNKIKLERVLGLTVSSNSSLDVNNGIIAYPAGCTVVFYNSVLGLETHLSNVCRKSITCLTFSSDGRYLCTGECGHQSNVRVWDMINYTQIVEFSGHKYGINCVAFSPNNKYIVSVGANHDMIVNIWEWETNIKHASNRVSTQIKAIAFLDNGNFITVGNRHVKFWYLQSSKSITYKERLPLMGRSAILGDLRNNDFVDVCCGRGNLSNITYAITKSGILCEFNNRRLLDKWVELKTSNANCITMGIHFIFVGCAEGIVRCFDPTTLQFITTLPRTHYLGIDLACEQNINHIENVNVKYPDTIAVVYDEINMILTCVYNDHSLYFWDVKDIYRVGKSNSFLFHSACIWGVEIYPLLGNDLKTSKNGFITCSSDNTIRFWNLDKTDYDRKSCQNNIYSNELLKIIYIDKELNFIKNTALNSDDKSDSSYDGRNGVRSIRMSPDGKHLASGDRCGNIRIYDLKTLKEVFFIEAHDAEILYLDYTKYNDKIHLLASASRDRLIHIFNVNKGYELMQTLDDHTSSVTAVRFIISQNRLQMVSCGADKSIIFRNYKELADNKEGTFVHDNYVTAKTMFYDMEIDIIGKHIITACQDRNFRLYNIVTGKNTKSFKGSIGDEEGSLIKVVLDNSRSYIATSCTNKTLCVFDYVNGECLASIFGHSELVTGLRFTNDGKHMISASGDGCIFLWSISSDMVKHTISKEKQTEMTPLITNIGNEVSPYNQLVHTKFEENSLSITGSGQLAALPLWAKHQISNDVSTNTLLNTSHNQINSLKGKWAQRATSSPDTSSILHINSNNITEDWDFFKDDSSVDSGTETSRSIYPENQKESLIVPKKTLHIPPVFITNDFEDNSVAHSTSEKVNYQHMSDVQRIRNLTDDSSLGSFKNEELENNYSDINDFEEDEKIKNPVLYYPSTTEDLVKDYTITMLDSNSLAMSQIKGNLIKDNLLSSGLKLNDLSSQEVSGSDDDKSTQSLFDNSDKHMLSTSNEKLDMIEKREQFLKNTFESLGKTEHNFQNDNSHFPCKKSISSQYKETSTQNTNIESQRNREELQKRINIARKTLQNVGSHSNLKTSQSICDLSRNYGKSPSKLPVRDHLLVDKQRNGNIRKVCSLIDLSKTNTDGHSNEAFKDGIGNSKTIPKIFKRKTVFGNIHRSSSVNVLDQSDSESDTSPSTRIRNTTGTRITRPTISSQNKIIVNKPNLLRRRSPASQSTTALNFVGGNENSSSEEYFTSTNRTSLHSKINPTNKIGKNTSILTRSVSEMNLNVPSNKRFENSRNRINFHSNKMKNNDYLSLMADQLIQATDNILKYTNCINNVNNSTQDLMEVMMRLENIVHGGNIFSHQNSTQALNNTQQYLNILIDLIKKRLSLSDI